MTEIDLDAHWQQLVTTALLGVERRDPPGPVTGPVGEVVADRVRRDAAARLLTDVAVTAAVRRAAIVADRPAALLTPPAPDPRPVCPPAAVASWRRIRDDWPVLEDEWVVTVLRQGWRIPAEVTVTLLGSARRDALRWRRARAAAGPVAMWLLDHVPGVARSGAVSDPPVTGDPVGPAHLPDLPRLSEMLDLPELPMPPELADLVALDAHTVVSRLLPAFHEGRIGAAHRPVLVNLVARCRPEVLDDLADALGSVDGRSASAPTGAVLAELARLRSRMLAELPPAPSGPPSPGPGT